VAKIVETPLGQPSPLEVLMELFRYGGSVKRLAFWRREDETSLGPSVASHALLVALTCSVFSQALHDRARHG